MFLEDVAPWAALSVALLVFLWLDLHFFARGSEPSFREALIWSIGWFVLSLLVGLVVMAFEGGEDAVLYTTVYLIERSLSLDNLFVFLILFAYFGVPYANRPRLLFWGIVAALVLRAVFILAGLALIEQFHFLIYLLGVGLLCVHLSHGASSMFQSIGWKSEPLGRWIDRLAAAGAIVLFLGYSAIPLAVLTGILK